MTLISSLHNLSRSLGCALLAISDAEMTLLFIGGEIGFFLVFKILRCDFHYWIPGVPLIVSLFTRIVVKVVADFTGCLHFRHPYELGGLGFTMSMLWAQAFPFVALQYFDGDSKDVMTEFLTVSFMAWLLLNIIFFCTIDLTYLNTFFGTKTAPQYTCELYLTAEDDFQKYDAIFTNRIQYTKTIHAEVKQWLAEKIVEWKREEPDWFKIEIIPDEFLTANVLEAEGGAKRRRSSASVSFKEIIRLKSVIQEEIRVVPMTTKEKLIETIVRGERVRAWTDLAQEVYNLRINNYKSNFLHIKRIFEENEELVSELMELCPKFREILSHILEDKFGFRVQKVDWTSDMSDWGLEECRRVGCSLATFLRKRKAAEVAVDAWRLHYPQVDVLFKEVVGFEDFLLVIANNTLRDTIYGLVYRVCVGAVISIVDAVTDIYAITTYYQSEELTGKANSLMAMVLGNLSVQLVLVVCQYKGKSWSSVVKEALITMLFLRPAVDAYRVSTDVDDDDVPIDHLSEMIVNKGIEITFESIPGCILQLYVWLLTPEKAGKYALWSIGISCLTTGFGSAMIAFDMDVDVHRRKCNKDFYGYIPDDQNLRSRCFLLMTLMSTLLNLSRCLGFALLAATESVEFVLVVASGEIVLYLIFKVVRRDFLYWVPLSGYVSIAMGFFQRIGGKVLLDFTGCFHMRHPYELGGLGFTLSLVWAQIFPFLVLHFSRGKSGTKINQDEIALFLVVSLLFWLFTNIVFFCTIDMSYLKTFFGTKIAPQYACDLFLKSDDDFVKFDAIFTVRPDYSAAIQGEVKEWVAENIDQWRTEAPDWFKIEKIPDEFLPKDVYKAEGGAKRRKSSVSLREFVGWREDSVGRVHPQVDEEMEVEDL